MFRPSSTQRHLSGLRATRVVLHPSAVSPDDVALIMKQLRAMAKQQRATDKTVTAISHKTTALQKQQRATDKKITALQEQQQQGVDELNRRLALTNMTGASLELRKHAFKTWDDTAPAGLISGGTWTHIGDEDQQHFGLSALHVTMCYKSLHDGYALVVVPSAIADLATAVGLFDSALAELDSPGAAKHAALDVVVAQLDAKRLTAAQRADAFPLGPQPAHDVARDTPLTAWSVQMPLSGRMLGTVDGVRYFAEADGCVPGNSGAVVCPVRDGVCVKQPAGVYIGSAGPKRGMLAPLPRRFRRGLSCLHTSAELGWDAADPARSGEDRRGAFQLVKAQRVTDRIVRVCQESLRELPAGATAHMDVIKEPLAALEFKLSPAMRDAWASPNKSYLHFVAGEQLKAGGAKSGPAFAHVPDVALSRDVVHPPYAIAASVAAGDLRRALRQ